jgi:hypothetical protein
MRNFILCALTIAFIAGGAGVFPVAAQKKRATRKMRDITIYVYQEPASGIYGSIVPVKRRIVDYRPLDQAMKLLLKGANKAELKRNLSNFIYELKFVSARVVKGTAQIKFKFIHPEIAEESWEGGGFDRKNFNLAVEQTARQFPGVERVSFCIEGMQGYTNPDANGLIKCPF